jgi:hypothetical protein
MTKPDRVMYKGVVLRKARHGYAVLWWSRATTFHPSLEAAKAAVKDWIKRKGLR